MIGGMLKEHKEDPWFDPENLTREKPEIMVSLGLLKLCHDYIHDNRYNRLAPERHKRWMPGDVDELEEKVLEKLKSILSPTVSGLEPVPQEWKVWWPPSRRGELIK